MLRGVTGGVGKRPRLDVNSRLGLGDQPVERQGSQTLFDPTTDRLRYEIGVLRIALDDLDIDAELCAVLDRCLLEPLVHQPLGDRRVAGRDLAQQCGTEVSLAYPRGRHHDRVLAQRRESKGESSAKHVQPCGVSRMGHARSLPDAGTSLVGGARHQARPRVHAPHLWWSLSFMEVATEQQKSHTRHCTWIGFPPRRSPAYARAWLRIIRATPNTNFYAYTKEVMLHDRILEPERPPNAVWIISLGGIYDRYVDPRRHRVCDVFPTETDIENSGWHSQAESDLLAAYGPAPVAMAANKIPHLQRRQGDRRFSEWQREVDRIGGDDAGRPRRRRRAASAHRADVSDEL